MDRALRRYRRELVLRRWLRRLREKKWWKRLSPEVQILAAVRRVKNHYDTRSHPRKTCNYCNPVYRLRAQEKVEDKILGQELTWLDTNLQDLLTPSD